MRVGRKGSAPYWSKGQHDGRFSVGVDIVAYFCCCCRLLGDVLGVHVVVVLVVSVSDVGVDVVACTFWLVLM